MQDGTVSRLRFYGWSWGLKIYFRWNIVHFRKPYVCSHKLDVQDTNFIFTQFNRIRNHFLGCRIRDGRKTRIWFMGSDRHSSSRKHASEWPSTKRPVSVSNAKETSWKDWSQQCWFWFLKSEFFSSGSFVVNLWRQRSSDQDDHTGKKVLQCDMFPRPTQLLLIGCSIESIWTPRFKSNTLTPRTNSQTYWQKGISHVTNGTHFCVCLTSAISIPQIVLK